MRKEIVNIDLEIKIQCKDSFSLISYNSNFLFKSSTSENVNLLL
mgnify:CR=1 FL=1